MSTFTLQRRDGREVPLQYRLYRSICRNLVVCIVSEAQFGGKPTGKLYYQYNLVDDLSVLNKTPEVVEAKLRRLVKSPTGDLKDVPEMKAYLDSMERVNIRLVITTGLERQALEFRAKSSQSLKLIFDTDSQAREFMDTAQTLLK